VLLLQPLWSQLNFESILEHFFVYCILLDSNKLLTNLQSVFCKLINQKLSFFIFEMFPWSFSGNQVQLVVAGYDDMGTFHNGPRFQPPSFLSLRSAEPCSELEVGFLPQTSEEFSCFWVKETPENKGVFIQPIYTDIFLPPKISWKELHFCKGDGY